MKLHVLLWLVLALAGYTRLANLEGTFAQGKVFFGGLDSYYHVRRITLAVEHYPAVPTSDAYVNYPDGARLDWPVGFDLAAASLVKLAQVFAPGQRTLEVVLTFINPALGVLTCWLTILLCGALAGRGAGLIAGLFVAVMPLLTGYAVVGRVDHHAAEPLLLLVPAICLLRAVGSGTNRGSPRWAVGCGLALALGIAVWLGAVVVIFCAAASLGLAVVLGRGGDGERERLSRTGAVIFGTATLALVGVALAHPWAWEGSFAYFAPSWLHPACCLLALIAFLIMGRLARRGQGSGGLLTILIGVPAVGFLLLALLSGALRENLKAALGYVTRTELQIAQVAESLPLFHGGLARAQEQYTLLLYLTPVVWAALILRWRQLSPGMRLLTPWLAITSLLALTQLRLGLLGAPLVCASWAIVVVQAHDLLGRRTERRLLPGIIVGAGLLLALLPTAPLHRPVTISGTRNFLMSHDALGYLARQADRPGDHMDHLTRPSFSVLTPWVWGHWILQLAGQANVANPLGQTETNLNGVRASAAYYLSDNPREADQVLERRGVRYILAAPMLASLESVARFSMFTADELVRQNPGGKKQVQPLYFRLMNTRLHHFDGRRYRLEGKRIPPLRNLRLVFDCAAPAAELGRRLNYCKLFERVRGARLRGQAPPGSRVALAMSVASNRGRRFDYKDGAVAGADGAYEIQVPYATGQRRGMRVGAARVAIAGQARQVTVSEAAVREGLTVTVP